MARRKDEELHARRRREILEAAAYCFAETGLRQARMHDICAAARISPGALYRYFASKEEIIAALAASEAEANAETMAFLDEADDPVAGLRAALPAIVAEMSSNAYGKLSIEIAAEAIRNPELVADFIASERALRERLGGRLKRAQEAGSVRADHDAATLAHLVLALLHGLSAASAFPSSQAAPKLTEAATEAVVRLLRPDDVDATGGRG